MDNETKHTPTTWCAVCNELYHNHHEFGSDPLGSLNGECSSLQDEANANLIAASPELYESLEDVIGLIPLEFEQSPMVAFAKAALAKARGEAV